MNTSSFQYLTEWFNALRAEGGDVTSTENTITYAGILTRDIYNKTFLLSECDNLGEFEDSIPLESEIGKTVELNYFLPKTEQGRFYKDLSSLMESRSSLSKGVFKGNYYIIDLGFSALTDDFDKNISMNKLKNICNLISFLYKLNDLPTEKLVITFSLKSTEFGDILNIYTKLNMNIFNRISANFHLNLHDVNNLASSSNSSHYLEKQLLFKLAVAQLVYQADPHDRLLEIINNWDRLMQLYKNNLSAYLENFSFEKNVLKITEEKIKLVKSINDIIKDSVAKMLTMPLSYGVILIVIKEPMNFYTSIIGLVSLFIFGCVQSLSLCTQEKLKEMIVKQSLKILSVKNMEHGKVKNELEDAKKEILNESNRLSFMLKLYHIFAWLPFALILFIFFNIKM
jgi:hypothetical protein